MPAEPDSMNYVSACYAIIVLLLLVDWFARARKEYRGQTLDRGEGIHSTVGI